MPYFKLIILAVTAVNCIAVQSMKNGELQTSNVNIESKKEEAKNEIQNEINDQRSQLTKLKKHPDPIQQNPDAPDILYNERKNAAALPPPLLQLLYSHGSMKFPSKPTHSIPPLFPPQAQASFPAPQQPNTVAGFLIAYSPTPTIWNSAPMLQRRISDEQLDPLAVEESQVFIEIAQPQTGYPQPGKQSQYVQPAKGQMETDSESSDVDDTVQFITSANSAKLTSKMNRLGNLANSELQPTVGAQQQLAVVNTVGTLQQQPRTIVNRVGPLQQQQQPNVGAVQRQQIGVGNTASAYPPTSVGRSGVVAVPQHPPVVSGFPTFSISFDPLNFLLSLLNFLPIPKLNLDGRTFFGVELKKGFNFPPEAPGSSHIQIGQQQQQPYRRGTVIHFG